MKNEEIKNELTKLNNSELKDISKFIENILIPNEINTAVLSCPKCCSTTFKKNGVRNGKQMYKCTCGRNFSARTNTLLHSSKVSKADWIKFIDYEISGITLKDAAHFLDVSVTTAFNMRHKLYECCEDYINSNINLSGEIELDASYTKINLKGTKPENMPRFSKKRGGTSAFSGISHHKVCVLVAIDEADNIIMKIAGLGPESFEKYKSIEDKFIDPTLIISDSKACIKQFANHIKAENDNITPRPNKRIFTTPSGNHVQDVNQAAGVISSMICRYKGISTRYFNGYLAFQSIKKMVKYKNNRNVMATDIFDKIKLPTERYYSNIFPIDLKEAYWEYNYGIFRR